MILGKDNIRRLPLPVGTSDWATFSRDSYCVDKTLMIKELIDTKTRVALFTRPRRFGKTTALKMIRAFYEGDASLFVDKKIWAAGEEYRKEQGAHPVIYLTFKDVKQTTAREAFGKLASLLSGEIFRHRAAVTEGIKNETKKKKLDAVYREKASRNELAESLGLLAEAIHAHTGKLPVILIDEYDQPITTASVNGFYDEMCTFMRVFLSGALKDNEHCHLGLMTGVLRVAKEGILSGLNNPKVWTVFDEQFSKYFGFTGDEVETMAKYYGAEDKLPEIKAWYNGYAFGGTEIYNPWSVLQYFDHGCKPDAYWLDTSSNDLITELVRDLPHDMVKTLEALLRDETPWVQMAKDLGPYKSIKTRKDSLYALLVSAGYLKVASELQDGLCKVAIPNHEIAQVFVSDIKAKINNALDVGTGDIVAALLERDAEALKSAIASFLLESVSYFDAAAEGFFHGLTLG
ncbi:MAG: AAA family ATPase, partial [bacterium]|nr:AAA family ATPase [bacterium]